MTTTGRSSELLKKASELVQRRQASRLRRQIN